MRNIKEIAAEMRAWCWTPATTPTTSMHKWADELEKLARVSDKTEWQPIETAPKDGTHILGFDGSYMTTVEWWEPSHKTEPGSWNLVQGCIRGYSEWEPTHWMPLPEPPK